MPILLAMQEGGCDAIELGVPFTDPLAGRGDGAAVRRSRWPWSHGVTLVRVFELLGRARTKGPTIPVVLMGYSNPNPRAWHRAGVRGGQGGRGQWLD